jgi:hypothetical protein
VRVFAGLCDDASPSAPDQATLYTSGGVIFADTAEAWQEYGFPHNGLIEIPGTSWDGLTRQFLRPDEEVPRHKHEPSVRWFEQEEGEARYVVIIPSSAPVLMCRPGTDIVVDTKAALDEYVSVRNWQLVRVPATMPGRSYAQWRDAADSLQNTRPRT